jgi:hypothetical protein
VVKLSATHGRLSFPFSASTGSKSSAGDDHRIGLSKSHRSTTLRIVGSMGLVDLSLLIAESLIEGKRHPSAPRPIAR